MNDARRVACAFSNFVMSLKFAEFRTSHNQHRTLNGMNEDFLYRKLQERKDQHSLRQLRLPQPGRVDLCSNDYLGIARNNLLEGAGGHGSTGSRLLTGNYAMIEDTEKFIAAFHEAEAALIFNSGYDANLGLLSAVAQRGDTILYDQLCHASIRDGIRLSFAQSLSFQHNDISDLQKKIEHAAGTIFIVTESVFSMDGDTCPMKELLEVAASFNANLIVDEAHATGVIGEKGEGLVQMMGYQQNVFARVHTFGKACGAHGAVILGSATLRQYLINFARSFVYSTALPEQTIAHIKAAYELFPGMKRERAALTELVACFRSRFKGERLESSTPVQGIIIPGNERVKLVAGALQAKGLDVRPILYPTVPKGGERLRVVLHAFNTKNELDLLLDSLQNSW
jgi:8-amino-7-oxononanoate synthase